MVLPPPAVIIVGAPLLSLSAALHQPEGRFTVNSYIEYNDTHLLNSTAKRLELEEYRRVCTTLQMNTWIKKTCKEVREYFFGNIYRTPSILPSIRDDMKSWSLQSHKPEM